MSIQSFIHSAMHQAWSRFPRASVDFGDGLVINGVIDYPDEYSDKGLGGMELQDTLILVFKASSLADKERDNLIGTRITVENREWRIVRMRRGSEAITLECESPNKA